MNFTPPHQATNLTNKLPLDDVALEDAPSTRVPNNDMVGLTDAVRSLVVTATVPAPATDLILPTPAAAALRGWISALPKVLSRWPALIDAAVQLEIRIERLDLTSEAGVHYRAEVAASPLPNAQGQGSRHSRRTAAADGFASVVRGSLQRMLDAQAPFLVATGIRQLTLTGILGTRAPSAIRGRDPQSAGS